MGKLKFTLVNIWFWVALVFISFLTENLMLLTSNFKSGFSISAFLVLTIGCLASLFMFYFVNHKKNGMKFDWVLLPAISIIGIFMLIGIWLENGGTFTYSNGERENVVSFSIFEKIQASVILILFLAFMYAMLFAFNINRPHSRKNVWFIYIGVFASLLSIGYSLATEINVYKAIFDGDPLNGLAIVSFYGNKNYYGGVLFIGILSCIVATYYKPRLHWYLLMCFQYIILISTAAVLPTLVSSVVVPIYLLEEVIRFAIKKKWKYCIFALASILLLIGLILLFYIGCVKEWKSFNGINLYLTEVFQTKNFLTFSGRTKIWENILPYCVDNPIHAIFGHGFMISEKIILAITGASDNAEAGVRTTHNGYFEMLFDYGFVGLLIYFVLLCYFLYICIRLFMEKRRHFVFIHLLIFIACCAYNFCESSSFFDAGVKEIYMTFAFILPVFSEYKFIKHHEKVDEIKDCPVEHKFFDPITLGQSISLIIISLIVASIITFASSLTYSHVVLKNTMLNVVIGLGITLIFVPYLVSLLYKGKDRLLFISRISVTFITLIGFLIFTYISLSFDASTKGLIKYIIPVLFALILLVVTLIYHFIKNGSLKDWFKIFVNGSFIIPKFAILSGVLCGFIPTLIFQSLHVDNLFIYCANIALSIVGFYIAFYFLPSKQGQEIIDCYNDLDLYNIKRIALKDVKYDG